MKDFGYYYLIFVGLIVGIVDILVIDNKVEIIDVVYYRVEDINKVFCWGLMIEEDCYVVVIIIWCEVKEVFEKCFIEI